MSLPHGFPFPLRYVCTKGRSFTLFPDRTIEFENPSMCRLVVLESDLTRYDFSPPMWHGWGDKWYGPRPGEPVARIELHILDQLDNSTRYMRFEIICIERPEQIAA